MLRQMKCTKGQVIVKQGAPAFEAYYIEEGSVEVQIEEGDHTIILAQLGPGELFGEMGVIEQEPREASVVAIANCSLLVIPKDEIQKRIEETDEKIVRSVIKTLIERLRSGNKGILKYHKNMAEFHNRMASISSMAKSGIASDKREAFKSEVMPILDKLEKALIKYQ